VLIHHLVGEPSSFRVNVPAFGAVREDGVYDGIDLLVHGRGGELEYDFLLAAGADPGAIALDFENVLDACLDKGGGLVLETDAGVVRQRAPVVAQEHAGGRVSISAVPLLERLSVSSFELRFRLGPYDSSLPLVIDPAFSTLIGGDGEDSANGVAV